MEKQLILLDTSVLIDYYRKTDKSKSYLFQPFQQQHSFAISTITKFEIFVGAESSQKVFWDNFFVNVTILPFDNRVSENAVAIYK